MFFEREISQVPERISTKLPHSIGSGCNLINLFPTVVGL